MTVCPIPRAPGKQCHDYSCRCNHTRTSHQLWPQGFAASFKKKFEVVEDYEWLNLKSPAHSYQNLIPVFISKQAAGEESVKNKLPQDMMHFIVLQFIEECEGRYLVRRNLNNKTALNTTLVNRPND